MKIERLRLRGSIGIKKGLGLDEIDLDLSGLSGLVALSGENGRGKTTVLENMHPFRVLPSRPGKLADQFFLRDSIRELTFTMDGQRYRSEILLDAKTGLSEAYLYLNGNTKSETNGKLTEYDGPIFNLLGSQDLFFKSIFCSQKSEKFADMAPADTKKLMNEFLGLHRYVTWEKTASRAAAVVVGRIAEIEKTIDALIKVADTLAQAERAHTEATIDLDRLERVVRYDRELLTTREREREGLAAQVAAQAVVEGKIQVVQARIDAIQADADKYMDERTAEARRHLEKILAIETDRKKIERTLEIADSVESAADRLEKATASRRENQAMVDELVEEKNQLVTVRSQYDTEIQSSLHGIHKLQATLASLRDKVLGEITCLERNATDTQRQIADLNDPKQNGMEWTQAEIKFAEKQVGALDKKDPACTSTTCRFIVGALEAQKNIPALQQRLVELQAETAEKKAVLMEKLNGLELDIEVKRQQFTNQDAEYRDLLDRADREHTELTGKHEALNRKIRSIDADIQSVRKDLAAADKEIAEVTRLAGLAQEVAVAKSRHQELIAQHAAAVAERDAAGNRWDAMIGTKASEKAAAVADLEKLVTSIDHTLPGKIAEADAKTREIKTRIADADERLPIVRAELAVLDGKMKEFRATQRQIEDRKQTRERLAKHAAAWQHLSWACGKDGLRALEIDAVAPTISAYANELLLACYGRETITINTQDPETGKEVLEILVNRDGDEPIEIDLFSGGESVWIQKAARLALTRISKEKSGRNILTCMADEEDGALDAGKSRKFIEMYRQFMGQGGFDTCFFISHKPECIAMADREIHFGRGTITVN